MKKISRFFESLGEHIDFFKKIISTLLFEKFEGREFLSQLSQISMRSLPTTLTAGLFTGAILALQFYIQLKDFGAESALGGLNTSGTLREVGPILIAFMLAGKVGSFTSAELGTMKVTDQIDALRCLGINPISFLIVPRFLAVLISGVLLLSFGLVISVLGGMAAASVVAGINPAQYLSMIPRFTNAESLILALSKAGLFGLLMGHICCANGYWTKGGTQGVGQSVRNTAVQSMVAIVLSDFAVTWILNGLLRFKEGIS
jgi:phospholipid/cholesterol/gamma-HCH transport system permease protein